MLGLKYADRGCQFGGRKLCIYTSIPRARQKGEDKRLPGGIKRAAAGCSVDNAHLRGSVPSAQEKRRGVSLAEQLKVAIKEKGNIENGWQIPLRREQGGDRTTVPVSERADICRTREGLLY